MQRGLRRWHRVNQAVNKPQLPHHLWRQDERIQIGLANAVVEAVDRASEREPRTDKGVEVVLLAGIKIDVHAECGIASGARAHTQAEGMCRLQASTMCR